VKKSANRNARATFTQAITKLKPDDVCVEREEWDFSEWMRSRFLIKFCCQNYISALDCQGRTIFAIDAHRDGQRFIVRADEKLTAFVELEAAIRNGVNACA
jgi:hypothetical protein